MSLFGFLIGMMLANFHVCGIVFVLSVMFKFNMLVRYVSQGGTKCFKCMMFGLSGPVELLFVFCFMTFWTCEVVRVLLCDFNLPIALSMSLLAFCVLCFTVLINNCLLKLFATFFGVVSILFLNVMVLLFDCLKTHIVFFTKCLVKSVIPV